MTKVSIIIPLHNAESYIGEAVDSCLNQTYANIEVIVVENGSNDGSWNIISNYKDSRISRFQIEASSATVARNYGYKKSTGNYIMFLDSDDVLSLDKISNQMALFAELGNDVLISCAWGKFTNDISKTSFVLQKVWNDLLPVDWLVTSWAGGGMMQTACWLTPRGLIEKAGLWDETLKSNPNDDGDFFSRVILSAKKVHFCKKSKVYYRTEINNSLSTKISEEAKYSLLHTFINYENNILTKENSNRVRLALAYNYLYFIYRFYPKPQVLISVAKEKITNLKVDVLPLVGGNNFKNISKMFGFYNALKLRQLTRDLKS
ncbi:glycosyltransferase family 2 protein [Flavobacteriaceae bacterium]|nr:glycosyltransferase family 2 protein [Flavobacteriaceae bacterium]